MVDRKLAGVTRVVRTARPATSELLLRCARGHDRLPAGGRDNMRRGVVRRDEHDRACERLLGSRVVLRQQPTGREEERRHKDHTKAPTEGLHNESIAALPDGAVPIHHRRNRVAGTLRA